MTSAHYSPPLVLASQMGVEFDRLAAQRPGVAKIISLPPDALPLDRVAAEANGLLARPGPLWAAARETARPDYWPGRVRWVQSASAGIDFYPRWLGETQWFSCGRGIASEEIADYVIAALYAYLRSFESFSVRGPEDWVDRPVNGMIGRSVAILGLGSIGLAVARRLLALGARPVGVRRTQGDAPPGIHLAASLEQAVADAQDIIVALPATGETKGIVNRDMFARVQSGAHLVNVSRGAVIDHRALLRALDDGSLGFATLDVTDPEPLPEGHPLYDHPLVRLTPHMSCNWSGIMPTLHSHILENVDIVARNHPPRELVEMRRGY